LIDWLGACLEIIVMIITSTEFDKAIEKELDRLTKESINAYTETEEFYERLELETRKELAAINSFFLWRW